MWGGSGQGNSPDHYGGTRRSSQQSMEGQDASTPEGINAATLAARMAFANAYDTAVPGAPVAPVQHNYYDMYNTASAASAGQQSHRHSDRDDAMYLQQQQQQQYQRKLEFLQLQQQMERRALLGHAATLSEFGQGYGSRSRMQMDLMRGMLPPQQQQLHQSRQQQPHQHHHQHAHQQHHHQHQREAMLQAERKRLQQEVSLSSQPDLNNNISANNMWNTTQDNSRLATQHHDNNNLPQHHPDFGFHQQHQIASVGRCHFQNSKDHEDSDDDNDHFGRQFEDDEDEDELAMINGSKSNASHQTKPLNPHSATHSPHTSHHSPQHLDTRNMEVPRPTVDPTNSNPHHHNHFRPHSHSAELSGSTDNSTNSAKIKVSPNKEEEAHPPVEGSISRVKIDLASSNSAKKQKTSTPASKKKKPHPKDSESTSENRAPPKKKAEKTTEKKASPKVKKSKPPSKPIAQPTTGELTAQSTVKSTAQPPDHPTLRATPQTTAEAIVQPTAQSTVRPAAQPHHEKSPQGGISLSQFDDADVDTAAMTGPMVDPNPRSHDEVQENQPPKMLPANASPATSEASPSAKTELPTKEASASHTPVSTPSASLNSPKAKIKIETKTSNLTPEPKTPTANSKKRKKSSASKTLAPDSVTSSTGTKAKKAKKSPGATGTKKVSSLGSILTKRNPGVPTISDTVPPITDAEWENVESMMAEFCGVPFLSEFSRPVSLLHPELMELYGKIVHHPMDLGYICRKIRRREYKNTRAIQLDVWRVFSNCVKFHTHPSNRENAIPSFASISMHLRDFFNNLWQEYMMPSDAPPRTPGKGISHVHQTFQKRAESRKERLVQVATTTISKRCLQKIVVSLENFIASGGRVDKLDKEGTLGNADNAVGDVANFIQHLRDVIRNIKSYISGNQEYTVMALHRDLKKTYTEDVFENQMLKKMHIGSRLDRIFGKFIVPIFEVYGRGVNQSSVWGCMAAAIWARESKKKPYWPAIVLGILAPDDQREDWHQALTDRNEARLPEKLREQLLTGKRKAEQALKKQGTEVMSYFLVEFMGSHEFIWVRESDIIDSFDPDEDVNVAMAHGNVTKKRRSTASFLTTKAMSDAIEEGRWALEEFELQLNDTCGDGDVHAEPDDEAENEYESNFVVLCGSDDEADEMESMKGRSRSENSHESDIDEQNELLASDGTLDFTTEGRKKAKLRTAALKKQNALRVKKEKEREKAKEKEAKAKKIKVSQLQKKTTPSPKDTKTLEKQLELEEKREKRELELRRKKRSRDHEKMIRDEEQKVKKKKSNTPDKKTTANEVPNKRGRAETMVKSFLVRKFMSRELKDVNFDGCGPSFQAQTNIEPDGLLGMTLAFRAAAGEVPYVDNSGKPFIVADWEKIDSKAPALSSERCKRLQEQIELIQQEIKRVNETRERRLSMIKEAERARDESRTKLFDAEKVVRETYLKKKKKTPKKQVVTVKAEDPRKGMPSKEQDDKKPSHSVSNHASTTDNELEDSNL